MPILSVIQINIEIMLAILCVLIWILTTVWAKDNRQPFHYIWRLDLLTVGLLISDTLAMWYRGVTTDRGYIMVRGANFFNFFFLYSMILYLSFLIDNIFEHPSVGKKRVLTVRLLSTFALLAIIINLFVPFVYDFDEQNKYYRKAGWYTNTACLFLAIILLATLVIQLRKEIEPGVFIVLLLDILMPFMASIVQVFIYGIAITNIAIGITQILLFMITFRYQEMKIHESDIQLREYNAKLVLTQVQPHFMLNTLSTIQYLCKTDSQAAVDTISDLGIYLRNNMDFAALTQPIPFEKELSHIEKYVSIEQKRFGDRIRIKYDIKEKDFELPALSVQPLVENAIKHGISKRRKGGTVELSTERGDGKIHIVVKDDGVGFDPNKPFSSDRVHLGLSAVRDRLKRECGGDVYITSEPDNGTICEITIPIEFG